MKASKMCISRWSWKSASITSLGLLFGISAGLFVYNQYFAQPGEDAAQARRLALDAGPWIDAKRLARNAEQARAITDSELNEVATLLRHKQAHIRRKAAVAIQYGCRTGNKPRGLELLEPLLRDSEGLVRATALLGLYRMDPANWERYAKQVETDQDELVKMYLGLIKRETQNKPPKKVIL